MKQPCTKKIKRMQIRQLSQRETRVASCLTRDYIRIICECFRRACATESPCPQLFPSWRQTAFCTASSDFPFFQAITLGCARLSLTATSSFFFLCADYLSLLALWLQKALSQDNLEALLQDHLFKSIYVGKPFCRTCCFSIEPCPVCWGLHPGPASAQLALHAASAQLAHNKHW